MQRVDKRRLRKFYEEEAKRTSHQQLMYVKGSRHGSWWHRKRLNYVISFLTKAFKENHVTTFADLGCAEGYYLHHVTSAWNNVFCVGADIARNYIKKAKIKVKKSTADFIVCALENLPFRENCFDVVLCSEVLEHVPDHHKALAELHKVAGKHLVISFPGHSYIYKAISKVGVLKRLVDNITPGVGHISDIAVSDVESSTKTHNVSMQIRIGGVLPLELYKFLYSVKLVNMIDNLLCKILEHLHTVNYATIHVMKVTKESS